jgi:uncharacterized protein YbaP (TraB family)
MKKLLSILLNLVLISFTFSQTSIWEVSGKGTTLYLGGSIHILHADDYPLPPEYDNAYNKSEVMVFETDIKKLEDPKFAQSMLFKAMYQDGRTLKSVLSPKVYESLKTACTNANLPIENLAQFKPSMVILLITMEKMKELNITEEGIDKYFDKKAIADKKEILALETVEEQINLLTTMGDGNEDEFVKHSLKDIDEWDTEMAKLTAAWRSGSSKEMNKQLDEMKKEYPALYTAMLVDRNNKWMPQIDGFLDSKTVEFVIVGTLHLHGTDGLLALLKAKGYTVKQLTL